MVSKASKAGREAIQRRGEEQRQRREVLGSPAEGRCPLAWYDAELMGKTVDIGTSLFRCTVLHGLIALGLKLPELPESVRVIGAEMKANLEQAMELAGLPAPLCGWDGE
jgi:hypothetical protein